jgi:branched-chain amino acid transport system permease protein
MVLGALPEVLRFVNEFRGIVNGAILLLIIVYLPGGLVNPAGWLALWRRLRPVANAETLPEH